MSDRPEAIYTIGHSNHSLERLLALLEGHQVSALADVRSAPFSRFNPQFNRENLEQALKLKGLHYVYLGKELGGRSSEAACFEDGRVVYSRLASTSSFRDGIERLVVGSSRFRIALLCAEREPLDCHRTLLVAPALEERGISVTHIHASGQLEPNEAAMDRLLSLHDLPTRDLFRSRHDLVKEAIRRQERRVAYADEKMFAQPKVGAA
jgi:uncharacterized protein (DUF488 family)